MTQDEGRAKQREGLTPLRRAAWAVAQACPRCAEGVPHHTVGRGAIGDAERYVAYDIHEVLGPGGAELEECLAYEIWIQILGDVREAYRRGVGGTAS